MLLTIANGDCEILTIRTSPEATTQSIKRAITEVTGIPESEQTLSFNGFLLKDECLLREMGLVHDSLISLFTSASYGLILHVNVKLPDGSSIVLPVTLTETVEEFIRRIETGTYSPCYLVYRGKVLKNKATMKQCEIIDDCSVVLKKSRNLIHVNFMTSDHPVCLEVDQFCRICDFLEAVGEIGGRPVTGVSVMFSGFCVDPSKTFFEAGIDDRDLVLLKVIHSNWCTWLSNKLFGSFSWYVSLYVYAIELLFSIQYSINIHWLLPKSVGLSHFLTIKQLREADVQIKRYVRR